MNRHKACYAIFKRQRTAAQAGDGRRTAEHAAHRGRAQGNNHLGLEQRAFEIEPPSAAVDLVGIRALVQPALAAHLVLEVLDRVGHEHGLAVDARVLQGAIEHASGRTNERLAGTVLLVARLLANQQDGGILRTLARHRLGGVLVERAAPGRRSRPRATPPGRWGSALAPRAMGFVAATWHLTSQGRWNACGSMHLLGYKDFLISALRAFRGPAIACGTPPPATRPSPSKASGIHQ